MGTISGIMVPTLGVLTAAGIIKGVVSFLALDNIGVLNPASGLYMLLYAIGDGFFYFLPILLGVTAARKFQCSEFIGASVGTALVYPAMVNIAATMEAAGTLFTGSAFEMAYYNTLFGIPIVMPGAGYASNVFPVIVAMYLASKPGGRARNPDPHCHLDRHGAGHLCGRRPRSECGGHLHPVSH